MASLSRWPCSLVPSAPRMKARPLELPAMRPVSGADSTSIRFFHTPVRMKREKTDPGRMEGGGGGGGGVGFGCRGGGAECGLKNG